MPQKTTLRIIKLGLTNFWRNGWLSLAATFVMTLTLIIISVFLIFNLVIDTTTTAIKKKIDLSVYFNDTATETQIRDLKFNLEQMNDVKEVTYVSKEEALKRWEKMQKSEKIRQLVTPDNNPLPRSLEVKVYDPSNLEKIANIVSAQEYRPIVRKVSYQENKQLVEKLINITNFSRKIGIILSTIFIAISILVILNTIRLTIFTRETEIEIMRLVGANDSFIRIPFLIEGALYGVFATVISLFLIWLGLHFVSPMVERYLGDVNLNLEGFFLSNFGVIAGLELLVAVLVSINCSLVSIRKNLKI